MIAYKQTDNSYLNTIKSIEAQLKLFESMIDKISNWRKVKRDVYLLSLVDALNAKIAELKTLH